MTYKETKPSKHLQHIVRLFWMYEEKGRSSSFTSTYRIIADGCPGLIIQYSDNGTVYYNQDGTPVSRSFLYGQTTKPVNNYSTGAAYTFGVYFQPWAIPVIFGFGANELTNTQVDFSLINASLCNRIIEAGSFSQRVQLISEFIYRKINNNSCQHHPVHEVAKQILISGGAKNLHDLYSDSYITSRTLVRNFKKHVGITPKHFSKIVRFQSAKNLIQQRDASSFADMAINCGYADQSHFIREFKELSGFTPVRFLSRCREKVRNYPQLI